MPEDDEAALIARSQTGDANAFNRLVAGYHDRIYQLAYRMTGNHADAQDVAQDAFIKAYMALREFRAQAAFSTWLHRIAVNVAVDMLRRRGTRPGPLTDLEATAADPLADGAERIEIQRRIQRAIAALPVEQRTAVVLRDMQECSYEEIAEVLKVPMGTVRSRLSRAREALRMMLADLAPSGACAQGGGTRS